MNISVVCSSRDHPVFSFLEKWVEKISKSHKVELVQYKKELSGGEILFLVSCGEFIELNIRQKYHRCLVLHASKLPEGRGWSPHIWKILKGRNEIYVSLLEAEDVIDTGRLWKQVDIRIECHELYDEINNKLFECELMLMDFAIENYHSINPISQSIIENKSYPKRTSKDSELDPDKTISEQFNLLRVSDPNRYPAYFKLHGHTYELTIKKKGK